MHLLRIAVPPLEPRDHPLAQASQLTIEMLAQHPIVTYDFSFTGASAITAAFAEQGLTPNIALTALDADVIKTYVELGMGVGIMAGMAYDATRDTGLHAIPAGHLFGTNVSRVALKQGAYLRSYVYSFVELLAPALNRSSCSATARLISGIA